MVQPAVTLRPCGLLTPDLLTHGTLCLFAGLHAAADDAAGQRPPEVPGVLHRNPGHDVSVPASGPAHYRQGPPTAVRLCNRCVTSVTLPSLLQKIDFPSMRFTHYLLGYESASDIPLDLQERTAWTFSRAATLELTQ